MERESTVCVIGSDKTSQTAFQVEATFGCKVVFKFSEGEAFIKIVENPLLNSKQGSKDGNDGQ